MKVRGVTLALAIMPALLIVDWVNSLTGSKIGGYHLPVSAGEVARGLTFLGAFILVLLSARKEIRVTLGAAIIVGLATFPGFVVGIASGAGFGEADKLFKVLYTPVLIAGYSVLYRKHGINASTIFAVETVMGAIAGLSIVVLNAMGIGLATYGELSTASKGLFTAQNDIGLTMSLTFFCGLELLITQRKLLWGLTCALTAAGMLQVGTRTGTLAAFVLPVAMMWVHRRELRSRRRLPVMIALTVLMVGAMGIAGVNQYELIVTEGYQSKRFEALAEGDMPRTILLAGAVKYVAGRAAFRDVVGDGMTIFMGGVARALGLGQALRNVELDWMDLFGGYGLLGMFVVYGYYLWFYPRVFRLKRKVNRDTMYFLFGFLTFFMLHATVAGHALMSPLPGGAVAPVFALIWVIDRDSPKKPKKAKVAEPAAGTTPEPHTALA